MKYVALLEPDHTEGHNTASRSNLLACPAISHIMQAKVAGPERVQRLSLLWRVNPWHRAQAPCVSSGVVPHTSYTVTDQEARGTQDTAVFYNGVFCLDSTRSKEGPGGRERADAGPATRMKEMNEG